MLHLLPTNSLHVGMYVTDIAVEWHKHPTLFSQEGLISSPEALESIQEAGFTEAYVDLKKSQQGVLPPGVVELLEPLAHSPFQNAPFTPKVALHTESSIARKIYNETLELSHKIANEARNGMIDVASAKPCIEDIYTSLDRNHDALLGITKLRQADEYTYTHSINVSIFSILLSKALGASREAVLEIGLGALFHDFGKYYIPPEIINAPRKLTPEEFAVMKQHPSLGAKALTKLASPTSTLVKIAKEHHEKFDGTGYPHGLAGDAISTVGALASIADIFDALTSKRAYKDPFPMSQALSIIYSLRGEAFAPTYVDQFVRALGVFPFGTVVKLTDGRIGIVSQTATTHALRPKVTIIFDHKGRRVITHEIDLAQEPELKIESSVAPHTLGINPAVKLNLHT